MSASRCWWPGSRAPSRADGLAVRPFKPQNMSNNAAVTADGGEIGRAQALQARACVWRRSVDMNPVLLKPQSEVGAQLVVQGRVEGNAAARDYHAPQAQAAAACSGHLRAAWRETPTSCSSKGAGSPAEINLRDGDIANMGFADAADVPVVLVGDIDRGGVIASLVGTACGARAGRARAAQAASSSTNSAATQRLFDEGVREIDDAHRAALPRRGAVVRRAAREIARGRRRRARLADLTARENGSTCLADRRAASAAHRQFRRSRPARGRARCRRDARTVRAGRCRATPTLSSCRARRRPSPIWRHCGARAGTSISRRTRARAAACSACAAAIRCSAAASPTRTASKARPASAAGLGLLDIETVLAADKPCARRKARRIASSVQVRGYEMHLGRTSRPRPRAPDARSRWPRRRRGQRRRRASPAATCTASSPSDAFRRAWLASLRAAPRRWHDRLRAIRRRHARRASPTISSGISTCRRPGSRVRADALRARSACQRSQSSAPISAGHASGRRPRRDSSARRMSSAARPRTPVADPCIVRPSPSP